MFERSVERRNVGELKWALIIRNQLKNENIGDMTLYPNNVHVATTFGTAQDQARELAQIQ